MFFGIFMARIWEKNTSIICQWLFSIPKAKINKNKKYLNKTRIMYVYIRGRLRHKAASVSRMRFRL